MKKNKSFSELFGQNLKKISLIMRIATFLLCVFCLQLSALDIFSQTTGLNLNASNTKLSSVFDQIEESSDYRFLYNEKFLNAERIVDLQVSSQSINSILDELFENIDIEYYIVGNKIILAPDFKSENNLAVANVSSAKANSQQIMVTGSVKDENGEGIPGASVLVVGTTIGVLTDLNGAYSISVPNSGSTLSFSFVGYQTQEVVVGNQTTINIVLKEDSQMLDEVVVVGYGVQIKSTVTGAITKVGSDDLVISPKTNLTQSLAGSLSGVIINARGGEPGAERTEIFIRGRSTNANSDPLYVIDGIVRDYQGLDRLNSDEIESISVLKDASAAIYGSRAANGVVLITTKRGSLGKPTLDFTYNIGFSQPTRIPEMASSGEYAEAYNLRQKYINQDPRWTEEEVQKFYDGSDPINYPSTDWYRTVYSKWKTQQKANLSVTGGSENIKYFISGGYQNTGTPYNKGFGHNQQYNFRSNIDASIGKNLTVSLDISGRLDDIITSRIDNNHVILGYPYLNATNPNGSYTNARTGENVLAMVQQRIYGYINTGRNVFQSSISLNWKIPGIEGLSFMNTFAYDYNNSMVKQGAGLWYYHNYNSANDTYTRVLGARTATPNLTVNYNQGNSATFNSRLNFARSFGKNNFDSFIAYEQNTTSSNYLSGGRTSFLSFVIEELDAGSADKANQSSSGGSSATARQHFFGRFGYDYDRKYMFQFTLRRDGSQNFAKDYRWGWFPGVSVGWTISEEPFLKGNELLSFLKLRGSWGQLGNDNVAAFQYLTTYSYGSNYAFGTITAQGIQQTGAPNPAITWEVATTTDIALETRFWEYLLGVEVDFFYTKRSNILATRNASVPLYTGLTLPSENIGVIENKGVELQMTHRNRIGRLNYSLGGNLTYAKNTVIDIDEAPNAEPYQDQTGHPIGAALLYVIDTDYSGGIFDDADDVANYIAQGGAVWGSAIKGGHLVFKDMNNDGVISSLDRVRQDLTTSPQIVFGLNFSADYRGFDLSGNFQGQARAIARPFGTFAFDVAQWGNVQKWLLEDGWSFENTDGSKPVPALSSTYSFGNTTWAYWNANFVRLKNLQLGYTLPTRWTSNLGISNLRLYASGFNIFSIDKFKELSVDPEATDIRTLPPDRVINLGISMKF